MDKDGCDGNPCLGGAGSCLDSLAAIEKINGIKYTCQSCPDGFELNENRTKCEGIRTICHILNI